jgi:aminopeptidase N
MLMRTETPQPIHLKDYQPSPWLIDQVELDVRLDPVETRVVSRLAMRPNPKSPKPGGPIVLDGEALTFGSAGLDGTPLKPEQISFEGGKLTLAGIPSRKVVVEISSTCNPQGNSELSGLYLTNGIYCTQCEAEGFRRITYFIDRPDVLARYRVRIEGDKAACPVLLSNGNLVQSGDIEGSDRHFALWEDPHPKPSYLFALVAGTLAHVADRFTTRSGREVGLRIYVEPGKEDRCAYAMESLKHAMRWDEEAFGREYDLDLFMIVAVSDFNMGAMENKGLNVFNDKYILALPDSATDTDYTNIEGIIAHEYFHNWTGNRITCRDWFQLCLKEGLTVFRDQEFTSDVRSRPVKRISDVRLLRTHQFPEDAGPLAHPVRPSSYIEINNFYTATVYEKGAELCRMLKTLLGPEAFRKGMDLYFERHDGEAAGVEDFVRSMADASGRDLKQFFRWYEQAGTPEVIAEGSYDKARASYTLTLTQTTPATPGQTVKAPFHIPLAIGLVGANGEDLPLKLEGKGLINRQVIELTERTQSFRFTGLKERPVLSVNRGFSAPIKLASNLTDGDHGGDAGAGRGGGAARPVALCGGARRLARQPRARAGLCRADAVAAGRRRHRRRDRPRCRHRPRAPGARVAEGRERADAGEPALRGVEAGGARSDLQPRPAQCREAGAASRGSRAFGGGRSRRGGNARARAIRERPQHDRCHRGFVGADPDRAAGAGGSARPLLREAPGRSSAGGQMVRAQCPGASAEGGAAGQGAHGTQRVHADAAQPGPGAHRHLCRHEPGRIQRP